VQRSTSGPKRPSEIIDLDFDGPAASTIPIELSSPGEFPDPRLIGLSGFKNTRSKEHTGTNADSDGILLDMMIIRDELRGCVKGLQNQVEELSRRNSSLRDIILSELRCTVCYEIRKNIGTCAACNNCVCNKCVNRIQNQQCPICREKDPSFVPSPKLDRLVGMLVSKNIFTYYESSGETDTGDNADTSMMSTSVFDI